MSDGFRARDYLAIAMCRADIAIERVDEAIDSLKRARRALQNAVDRANKANNS